MSNVVPLTPPPAPPAPPSASKAQKTPRLSNAIRPALWDHELAVAEARSTLELIAENFREKAHDDLTYNEWCRILRAIDGTLRILRGVDGLSEPSLLVERTKA